MLQLRPSLRAAALTSDAPGRMRRRLTAHDLETMTVAQLRRHIQTYCPQIAPSLRAGEATKAQLLEDILKATENTAGVAEAVAEAAAGVAAEGAPAAAKAAADGSGEFAGKLGLGVFAALVGVGAGVYYYMLPDDDKAAVLTPQLVSVAATARTAAPAAAAAPALAGAAAAVAGATAALATAPAAAPVPAPAAAVPAAVLAAAVPAVVLAAAPAPAAAPVTSSDGEYAAALALLEKELGPRSSGGSSRGGGGVRDEEYAKALQVLSMPVFANTEQEAAAAAAPLAASAADEPESWTDVAWTIGAALGAPSEPAPLRLLPPPVAAPRAAVTAAPVPRTAEGEYAAALALLEKTTTIPTTTSAAPAAAAPRHVSGVAGDVPVKLLWGRFGYRMTVPHGISLSSLQSALCHRIGLGGMDWLAAGFELGWVDADGDLHKLVTARTPTTGNEIPDICSERFLVVDVVAAINGGLG